MKKAFFTIVATAALFSGCAILAPNRAPAHSDQFQPPPGDLILGMEQRDVLDNWGEPSRVQKAGVGRSGVDESERWIYTTGGSSYFRSQPIRIVYFEQGRVVGWETR